MNHVPKVPRKLLLNRAEIRKLEGKLASKGVTLVPLCFYWKDDRVKVQLAVCRGKGEFDKREDIKKREADRDIRRAFSHDEKRK
jgi:SsrA-binding protein